MFWTGQACICLEETWRRGERPWDFVKEGTDRTLIVMVWGCICHNGVGTLTKVEGDINADKYINILEDNFLFIFYLFFDWQYMIYCDDAINSPIKW